MKNLRAERLSLRRRIFLTTPILSSSARTRGWFRSENDEVAEAFRRAAKPGGPKILSFAEVLAILSRGHEN